MGHWKLLIATFTALEICVGTVFRVLFPPYTYYFASLRQILFDHHFI